MRLCVIIALAMAAIGLPSYAQYQNGSVKVGFRFPLDHRWTLQSEVVGGNDQGQLSNVHEQVAIGVELNVLKAASMWFDGRMGFAQYSDVDNRDRELSFQEGIVWRRPFFSYGFSLEERRLLFYPVDVSVSCSRATLFGMAHGEMRDSLFTWRVSARAVINLSSEVYDSEVLQRAIFSAGLFRALGSRVRIGAQYEVHLFGKNQSYFSDRHRLQSLCIKIEYKHNRLLIRRFRHL